MKPDSISWPEVSLGDVCEFKYGKSLTEAKRAGGDVPVFGSNGVVGQHNDAITDGPAIVVGRKGSFGEVNFSPVPCWPIDTTYFIDKSASNADLKWLSYRLKDLDLTQLNKAAAVPGLNREDAYRRRLLLPPLVEQRRIAAILDAAEALREKRRQSLAKLDTLTQAVFLDMFGKAATKSRIVPLVEVAEVTRGSFVNGPFGSNLLTSELQNEGVPVIYIRDIRGGEYIRVSQSCVSERKARDLEVCSVHPGDVLVAKVGDPPGIAAVYPQGEPEAVVTQDVIRIRISREVAVPEFIVGYLNSSTGQWKVAGVTVEATRSRFSLGDFKAMLIELPPINIQLVFANRLTAVEKLRKVQRASLEKLDALFASLQHRAFRGEL